ncbi:hypothetical protein AA637_12605 [Cyanobacterium sp. HL-69]|uniref:hypothetical protein n=1 Tax=Cyanobacterium sp. HL-69 TaxID=2054282 RepID=UPI000CA1419B|nr:hypothetical protein AA637_12605 [Cyanobacterium sp. HL-69]
MGCSLVSVCIRHYIFVNLAHLSMEKTILSAMMESAIGLVPAFFVGTSYGHHHILRCK